MRSGGNVLHLRCVRAIHTVHPLHGPRASVMPSILFLSLFSLPCLSLPSSVAVPPHQGTPPEEPVYLRPLLQAQGHLERLVGRGRPRPLVSLSTGSNPPPRGPTSALALAELYDYCVKEGHADRALIAKWRQVGPLLMRWDFSRTSLSYLASGGLGWRCLARAEWLRKPLLPWLHPNARYKPRHHLHLPRAQIAAGRGTGPASRLAPSPGQPWRLLTAPVAPTPGFA
jgi:hypothetical protein